VFAVCRQRPIGVFIAVWVDSVIIYRYNGLDHIKIISASD